jgi:hypothetical protein
MTILRRGIQSEIVARFKYDTLPISLCTSSNSAAVLAIVLQFENWAYP